MRLSNGRSQLLSGLFLSIFLGLSGCQGDESSIPDAAVYIKRNIYSTRTETGGVLNDPGACLYIDRPVLATDRIGFGGILIVHSENPLDGTNGYFAFDLACPVERKSSVRVGKPDLNLTCRCSSCSEEYNLFFGNGDPLNHISKEGLRRYTVHLDNSNNVIVTR
ncbi:MAG: hypothetical protein PHS30_06240 [Bacteroidales bacterium]|nr:hypothetical protein [Bacteroidales bacterium]